MKRRILSVVAGLMIGGFWTLPAVAQPLLEQLEQRLGEIISPPPAPVSPTTEPLPPRPATPVDEPGYLGLFADDAGGDRGAAVVSVQGGGPAETAGLRAGDVIVAVNGRDVRRVDDVGVSLAGLGVGHGVSIEIIRSGERRSVMVTLGRRPAAPSAFEPLLPAEDIPPPPPRDQAFPAERAALGIRVVPVTDQVRRRYGLTVRRGAVIDFIVPGSPADVYGLPLGGVIVSVGAERIDSPDDLVAVVAGAGVGDQLEIAYYKGDSLFRKTVRLAPAAPAEAPFPAAASEPPLRLAPPDEDRPVLRRLEDMLDRFITPPPLPAPAVDNRAEIAALRRQIELLQQQLEVTQRRVVELEKRLDEN